MQIIDTQKLGIPEIVQKLRRKRSAREDVQEAVFRIIRKVQRGGDEALRELTRRFDGVSLDSLAVSSDEICAAYRNISPDLLAALRSASRNIATFHKTTFRKKERAVETQKGVRVWREFRPIEKVGLYVPGGKAPYPSTVLMLGIPARLAGCREIVLCTPPGKDGTINPAILVAADLCGVTKIFKAGGAQAIAAMAYGTETIPKVYKIFGPGNQFVTTAKMSMYGKVDIDMPAGPSEVAVIADESANPEWIAADLLSQLEHGTDSQAVLIAFSRPFAEKVIRAMRRQMSTLSRRSIIESSFANSFAVVAKSVEEACEIANAYAPEHLEIVAKNERGIAAKILNAGSVFLGKYTSEPLGDYATGANHTLPTSGFAAMFSPLSVESFGKMIQMQKVSRRGIMRLRKTVETLASAEGLTAHKNAITLRLIVGATKVSPTYARARFAGHSRPLPFSSLGLAKPDPRSSIIKLSPYVCARQTAQTGVLLDANENAFGSVLKSPALADMNRYPDPQSSELKRSLSRFLDVPAENIFAGAGSDEVIDLLMRVFIDPGDEIIVFEPTYGMYRVAGGINGAVVTSCPLDKDFQIDLRVFSQLIGPRTKMAFCASPNNPTGNSLRERDIEELCRIFSGIVVVDEAYGEFSRAPSMAKKTRKFKNLVVLRTFSKAWGLAGLRVGYGVADAEIIQYLNKVKPPYNLNRFSSTMATKALVQGKKLPILLGKIIREREKLARELLKLGCEVFPSEANFLLVRVAFAGKIVERLAREFQIIVRDFSSKPRLADCFRITIGTPPQNRLFLRSLTKLL